MALTQKLTQKEIRERSWKKLHEASPEIECACGCGTIIKSVSWYGRDQEYVLGHHTRKYEDPKQYKREWVKRNLKSRITYSKNFCYKRKGKLLIEKGGKCIKCNIKYDGTNACMFDLHHRIPSKKEFNVGLSKINCYGWAKIKKEADKCDMICSNCHRILHSAKY